MVPTQNQLILFITNNNTESIKNLLVTDSGDKLSSV